MQQYNTQSSLRPLKKKLPTKVYRIQESPWIVPSHIVTRKWSSHCCVKCLYTTHCEKRISRVCSGQLMQQVHIKRANLFLQCMDMGEVMTFA